MDRERFEALVAEAVAKLPEEFLGNLENVDVVVRGTPTRAQLAKAGRGMTLLGLYEGVPHTKRTRGYSMILPDRITIFQEPIEAVCRSDMEIKAEVQRVVRHEVAHHFGLDDRLLNNLESKRVRRIGRPDV